MKKLNTPSLKCIASSTLVDLWTFQTSCSCTMANIRFTCKCSAGEGRVVWRCVEELPGQQPGCPLAQALPSPRQHSSAELSEHPLAEACSMHQDACTNSHC